MYYFLFMETSIKAGWVSIVIKIMRTNNCGHFIALSVAGYKLLLFLFFSTNVTTKQDSFNVVLFIHLLSIQLNYGLYYYRPTEMQQMVFRKYVDNIALSNQMYIHFGD